MKTTRRIWLGLALVWATSAACAEPTRHDLSGRVLQEDDSPVTNATVFVYTAGPKTGSGVVCPSCYPDCSKRAKTSAQGHFTIASLDPTLLFRLLVVAPGCESQYVTKVDPAQGAKTITLARLTEKKLKAPSRIAGLVLDASGKPLAGATVGPEGAQYGSSTTWGGTDRFVDPLAVTDERGQFRLFCTNTVQRVYAVVEGRGVAKRWVELTPGRDHLIRMQEGVTVSGTLQSAGHPVKGVVLGLVTKNRTCGICLHGDEIATDQNGFFLMPNVTPDREFVLYAKMDSMPGDGAMPPVIFSTGATGTRRDFGMLQVKPAWRVAGRIVLTDGARVPEGTRLFLGRETAWDHAEALIDENGRFEFRGVPEESVGLSVRVPGYKFSKRNASLDWLNGGLVGRVDRDIADLTLLMEPGQWRYNGEEGEPPSGESQPGSKPLRGSKP
jgi:hypothetical protein